MYSSSSAFAARLSSPSSVVSPRPTIKDQMHIHALTVTCPRLALVIKDLSKRMEKTKTLFPPSDLIEPVQTNDKQPCAVIKHKPNLQCLHFLRPRSLGFAASTTPFALLRQGALACCTGRQRPRASLHQHLERIDSAPEISVGALSNELHDIVTRAI